MNPSHPPLPFRATRSRPRLSAPRAPLPARPRSARSIDRSIDSTPLVLFPLAARAPLTNARRARAPGASVAATRRDDRARLARDATRRDATRRDAREAAHRARARTRRMRMRMRMRARRRATTAPTRGHARARRREDGGDARDARAREARTRARGTTSMGDDWGNLNSRAQTACFRPATGGGGARAAERRDRGLGEGRETKEGEREARTRDYD